MEFIATLPLLQIHLTAVFTTLVIVIAADLHGLLFVSGKMKTLPLKRMKALHRATWIGIFFIILAGLSMFSSYSEYLLSLPAFRVKLVFIGALLLNAFFIGKHLIIAGQQPFASLSRKERFLLLASGAVSTVSWAGAFISAQFLS